MLVWPIEADKLQYVSPPSSGNMGRGQSSMSEAGLFEFLSGRQGKLAGVVVTGGEPTLHHDLPEFLKKIKDLGYLVKLDTNGTNPERLARVLAASLVDYLAMDIKASWEKYSQVTAVTVDLGKIEESVNIIRSSGVPYEFRSTIAPDFFDFDDLESIGEKIRGADKWYLQKFQSNTKLVDSGLEGRRSFTDKEMLAMKELAEKYVKFCGLR